MAERLKAHDWKSCIQKCIGGSNPPLSATRLFIYFIAIKFIKILYLQKLQKDNKFFDFTSLLEDVSLKEL